MSKHHSRKKSPTTNLKIALALLLILAPLIITYLTPILAPTTYSIFNPESGLYKLNETFQLSITSLPESSHITININSQDYTKPVTELGLQDYNITTLDICLETFNILLPPGEYTLTASITENETILSQTTQPITITDLTPDLDNETTTTIPEPIINETTTTLPETTTTLPLNDTNQTTTTTLPVNATTPTTLPETTTTTLPNATNQTTTTTLPINETTTTLTTTTTIPINQTTTPPVNLTNQTTTTTLPLPNQTSNQTSNQTANITFQEETTRQLYAEINKPVQWLKTIQSPTPNYEIQLPIEASNISIESLDKKIKLPLKAKPIQYGIQEAKATSNKTYLIENSTAVNITYETPAPLAIETPITSYKKQIIVSSEYHYENILTYTQLPVEAPQSSISNPIQQSQATGQSYSTQPVQAT